MTIPDIEYTRSGDVSIAYQAFGHGPRNVVFAPQFSNLVFPWDNVDWRGMYERLSSFSRVIIFDKRGTGSQTDHATSARSRHGWTTSVP